MTEPVLRDVCRARAHPAAAVPRLPGQRGDGQAAAEGGLGRPWRRSPDAGLVCRLASSPSWRCSAGRRQSRAVEQTLYTWISSGDLSSTLTLPRRSAVVGDDSGHHRHRLADSHLLDRLHARGDRQRVRALLLVPEPVRRVHAGAGARRELPGAVRRLGRRRPLLVPADRLLVQKKSAADAGKKAFIVNRIGDFAFILGMRAALRTFGSLDFQHIASTVGPLPPEADLRHDLGGDAAAVHRRHRQVRADSALRLAARRDGRPDAGLRAHPRGDDGDRRRLHDRPQRRALQPRAGDAGDRRGRSARPRR